MSNIPPFPPEEGTSSPHTTEEKPPYKQPAFVVIDERNGKSQHTYFDSEASRKSPEPEQPAKGALSLRFLCLLGFIFCLVFGLGIFIWSIALTVLATLHLFRNGKLNRGVRSFWKLYTNTVIVGLGFVLGMISPTLGLGLIALYFSISSESIDNDVLRKILKRSFSQL